MPFTLVGPIVTRPVQDPLAVLLLNNRLCILLACKLASTVEQTGGYNLSIQGKRKLQLVKLGAQLSIMSGQRFSTLDCQTKLNCKNLLAAYRKPNR